LDQYYSGSREVCGCRVHPRTFYITGTIIHVGAKKQQLLDFWRAWQENVRIKHAFLWKAYSTPDGMVKYNYVEKDLPKEIQSGQKAKSKGRKQNGVNSKTSKGKGKAKAVTPPTSEEEPDDNDDQRSSAKDSDIAVMLQLVSREVIGRKAKKLSQVGR
jgi:hypothetical protein